jgi:RNA polymerase primary sigma factor
LISEGNIGLMKGVERFDPARGAKLSVYASFWIKQAIRRALANHARTVRLPSHVHDKLIHIGRAANRLQEILGREATSDEIAGEVGMTPAKVQRFRDAGHRCIPLDEPMFDNERQTLGDTIADTLAVSPDACLEQSTDLDMLRDYMSQLDARERLVLNGRYGLEGGEEKTLAAIGAELGVTREWIRQIEIQAIKKLRKNLKDRLVVLHQP